MDQTGCFLCALPTFQWDVQAELEGKLFLITGISHAVLRVRAEG
jgi:hypothetical protein